MNSNSSDVQWGSSIVGWRLVEAGQVVVVVTVTKIGACSWQQVSWTMNSCGALGQARLFLFLHHTSCCHAVSSLNSFVSNA